MKPVSLYFEEGPVPPCHCTGELLPRVFGAMVFRSSQLSVIPVSSSQWYHRCSRISRSETEISSCFEVSLYHAPGQYSAEMVQGLRVLHTESLLVLLLSVSWGWKRIFLPVSCRFALLGIYFYVSSGGTREVMAGFSPQGCNVRNNCFLVGCERFGEIWKIDGKFYQQ